MSLIILLQSISAQASTHTSIYSIYVQDVSFVAKWFAIKVFLQIFLNLVVYETFPVSNFLLYSTTEPVHIQLQSMSTTNSLNNSAW